MPMERQLSEIWSYLKHPGSLHPFFLLLNGLESCRDCPLDEEKYSCKTGPADSLLPLEVQESTALPPLCIPTPEDKERWFRFKDGCYFFNPQPSHCPTTFIKVSILCPLNSRGLIDQSSISKAASLKSPLRSAPKELSSSWRASQHSAARNL